MEFVQLHFQLLAKDITAKSVPQISLLSEAIVTHLLYKYSVSTQNNYVLFVRFLEYNRKISKPGSWLSCSGALYSHCS